ncbi:hypothetical protein [Streptomyces sp. NPDC020141]|uniref:hypothetical protein n=1 Tax=Streptomyces sp. NPDC020141 TaxID=3365065 RepID=UPI0037B81A97
MGIAFTHEQREPAASVRRRPARTVPLDEVRALLDDRSGTTGRPAHWDATVRQGLLGVRLPGSTGAGERAVQGLLMSRCPAIAGGTTQVRVNVVAERLLGLPRD